MVLEGPPRRVGRQALCIVSHAAPTGQINTNSIFKITSEYPLNPRAGVGKLAATHVLLEGAEAFLTAHIKQSKVIAARHGPDNIQEGIRGRLLAFHKSRRGGGIGGSQKLRWG